MKKYILSILSLLAINLYGAQLTYTTSQVQAILEAAEEDYTHEEIDVIVSGINSNITLNAGNIATNAGNIATNTAQIASNTAAIVAIQTNIAHGIIYIHDGTNTINTTVSTNYIQITGFSTNGNSNCFHHNVTLSTSNIVLLANGEYDLSGSLSFIGYNGDVYEGALFIGGVHNDIGEANVTASSSTAITPMTFLTCANVTNAPVTISLRIAGSAAHTVTIKQAVLRVNKIH